jgi:hypothetical protein
MEHQPPTKIIGLCGRSRVGKTTSAEILSSLTNYHRNAFATILKRTVAIMFAPEGTQTITEELKPQICPITNTTYARLLQLVGQGMKSSLGVDVWTKILFQKAINPSINKGHGIIIEDIRFPIEAKYIRDAGGIIIKISRQLAILNDGRNPKDEDITDTIEADYEILNNGTIQDLLIQLSSMIRDIGLT